MIDYSLRPRLEEALSQRRIPALSREEALALDNDYGMKVAEAVIQIASANIKGKGAKRRIKHTSWVERYDYQGRPYFPDDEYNCFLDNDPKKGCLQFAEKSSQTKFYCSLLASRIYRWHDSEKYEGFKVKEFKVPFSAINTFGRLFAEKGYQRDQATEKAIDTIIEESQDVRSLEYRLKFTS